MQLHFHPEYKHRHVQEDAQTYIQVFHSVELSDTRKSAYTQLEWQPQQLPQFLSSVLSPLLSLQNLVFDLVDFDYCIRTGDCTHTATYATFLVLFHGSVPFRVYPVGYLQNLDRTGCYT